MAIDPNAPAALLGGRDSTQYVQPISTGIKPIDRMGLMEILWYTRQLKRIAEGKNPNPNESGLWAFVSSVVNSRWGTYRTKRLRAWNISIQLLFFGNEMIIRFQYVADLDEELRVKALIKVTDVTVSPENALAYLVTRYPDRHNIEIIDIVTD